MRRYAMANQSGGAGKTTSATSLGTVLAQRGIPTLVLDLDSQRNASTTLGFERLPDDHPTLYDVMVGEAKLTDAIVPAAYLGEDEEWIEIPDLYLAVGSLEMSEADSILTLDDTGVFWLTNALDDLPGDIKVALGDCPASLGRLMTSIIVALENLIGCTKPGFKELEAIVELEHTIAKIAAKFARFSVSPQLAHVLICEATSHRSQGAIYHEAQDDAHETYGDKVLPPVARSIRVPEAYKSRTPVPIWDPRCDTAVDYGKVADALGFPKKPARR